MDVSIALWEQGTRPARGHAYATDCPRHLLNVPAGRMSAFPGQPDHFLEWARARDRSVTSGAYLERRIYGDYLEEILESEIRDSQGRLSVSRGEVMDIAPEQDTLRIHFAEGPSLQVDSAVLATGHPLPAPPLPMAPAVLESGRYRADPWDGAAVDGLRSNSDLLLVGSGLTAVDVLLQAREQGFRGTVRILSRRGLLPMASGTTPRVPAAGPPEFGERRVLSMLRTLRRSIVEAREEGADWRDVLDAIRPRTQELWGSLPLSERRRFLRHVRPYWEVHRHRIAGEVMAIVESELASRGLVRHAGRISSIGVSGEDLRVAVRPRGDGREYSLQVQRVVNCTGPNTGIEMCDSRLSRTLLEKGLCRADDLGIGLSCDPDGALVDSSGRPSRRLFTLGPLRKGELWESTAVPELRAQAERLAARLAGGGPARG